MLFALPARGGAQADSADSKQVVARVTDFAVAYNTYDVADAKEYQDRLSGLLTTEYQAEVVKITDALFTAIKDKKQKSGMPRSSPWRSTAWTTTRPWSLAVVDAKVTNTDNDAAVVRQFRWTIDVKKVKGEWRVSKFESVAAQPADAGQGDGTPTDPEAATPTPSSTDSPSAEVTPQ